ncbi:hypothetical protein AB0I53_46015 [Saccharopolyspora sp. NPDC050389]|uniref:hypothetical protein n=1 Tax=Saccharopolyspora sp. NPDC050389 TaxID=3155516 RepID=UPI0033DDA9CF
MRTVLRGSLGIALAVPLLFGLAPAAFAVSPAPAVAAQLAPQQTHHHDCAEGDVICEMHVHEHEHQHHLLEHRHH